MHAPGAFNEKSNHKCVFALAKQFAESEETKKCMQKFVYYMYTFIRLCERDNISEYSASIFF